MACDRSSDDSSRRYRYQTNTLPCRFPEIIDMGKGCNILPYVTRVVEGRALGAVGPFCMEEMCRTVREPVLPPRWPSCNVHAYITTKL